MMKLQIACLPYLAAPGPIVLAALHVACSVQPSVGASVDGGVPQAESAEQVPPSPASIEGTPVPTPNGTEASFAILETTDLHSNIRSFDYFKLADDATLGLERTASLIEQARSEFANTLLVDNGDTIQGSVLADYQALISPVSCAQPLAMYKAMNALGFDIGGVGNHEFNYGLAFLSRVTHTPFDIADTTDITGIGAIDAGAVGACAGPRFPLVLSNVFSTKTGKTLFADSALLSKNIVARAPDGKSVLATLKIGVLGFAPPAILKWDKRWLDGKITTKGVREVAPERIAELRSRGADLIVAVIHGGLDNSAYAPELENQAWYLAQIPGVDVMLMGHSHQSFPNSASSAPQFALPLVDKDAGTVAGVPALMANFWGQNLGVLALSLGFDGKKWRIFPGKTVAESRPISSLCVNGLATACDAMGRFRTGAICPFAGLCVGKADRARVSVAASKTLAPLVEAEHQATIAYVKTPIGTTDFEMSTYFSDVGDVSAIEIVNQAQADYVTDYVQQNLPQYAGVPVLSLSAPFKSGFQGGGDYTDVRQGPLAINNAADLYLYANTIYAVKVSGEQLQDWLETSATRFAQIDPASAADQFLINPAVPAYNFDILTDARLSYEIDITQPLPAAGAKARGRIKNLQFQGKAVDPAAEFIVATNNYRASGGGNFPGLDGSKTLYASPDSNRDILIAYIKRTRALTRVQHGSHRSFRFAAFSPAGRVLFTSAQGALAKAEAAGLTQVALAAQDDGTGRGLSLYLLKGTD